MLIYSNLCYYKIFNHEIWNNCSLVFSVSTDISECFIWKYGLTFICKNLWFLL